MKVKPGYKQTNVGLIPEDWGVEPLGKRSSFKTGPFGSTLHQSDYVHEGIPVINPMHIKNGRITPRPDTSISEEAAQRLNEFRMKPGEIIIGRRGDMGRCATVNDHNKGWICGTGSMLIRPRLDDPNFLTLVLSSPTTIKTIEDASVGSTMTNLNQTTLSRLNIQTPSIEEQRAIATAIGDIDALLESLNSLITKKRAIKQATMQQLLSGETRVSTPQNDWTDTTLGEIVERFVGGGTPSRTVADYWGGNIPWVSTKDFASFSPYTSQESITRQGLNNSAASLIPAETLLISTRMAVGRTAIYKVDVAINQDIKALIPRAHISQRFLLHWLNHNNHKISSTSNGSTVSGISINDLKRIKIKIPDIHEQNSIAKVLDDMDYDISILESRIHKTNSLKQAMMQELLTGRTRLI